MQSPERFPTCHIHQVVPWNEQRKRESLLLIDFSFHLPKSTGAMNGTIVTCFLGVQHRLSARGGCARTHLNAHLRMSTSPGFFPSGTTTRPHCGLRALPRDQPPEPGTFCCASIFRASQRLAPGRGYKTSAPPGGKGQAEGNSFKHGFQPAGTARDDAAILGP